MISAIVFEETFGYFLFTIIFPLTKFLEVILKFEKVSINNKPIKLIINLWISFPGYIKIMDIVEASGMIVGTHAS